MAQIDSTRFGLLEVADDLLYEFPRGLPGFEHLRRFAVIEREEGVFKWMQSMEDPEIAFLIGDPYFFVPDYDLDVPRGDVAMLRLRFSEDLAMAVIANVPANRPEAMTINLRAPIIFNIRERMGVQVVLASPRYPVKYAVLREWEYRAKQLADSKDVEPSRDQRDVADTPVAALG